MMIRKPVAEVFEALIDPAVTSHFWFSKGSGRLEAGKQIQWDWEMYGVGTTADVKAVDKDRRILIEWDGPENRVRRVDVRAEGRCPDLRRRQELGLFRRSEEAIESTGGFTYLLAGLKVLLEHGIEPNFVQDHAPDALVG